MRNEIGAMFWASANTAETVARLRATGFASGQMALPGDMDLAAIERPDLRLDTLVATYSGESYTDIPTVKKTVGFVPRATRAARESRTLEIVGLAAKLGVPSVSTHIGLIPDDTGDEDYIAVREMVRRVADQAGKHNITFALETGQETAGALLDFLIDVNRDNVGVNFDPANMILYGTGNPVEALDLVGQHVLSVHAKDGLWPSANVPGLLGVEVPLGQGNVNFRAFLTVLAKFEYEGPLFIEREIEDTEQWIADLTLGKIYLESIGVSLP